MPSLLDGLPSHHFRVILADPPWRFQTFSDKGRGRSPDRHYKTAPSSIIASLNVQRHAADDCVLFLWATWPMLNDALWVIKMWGFTYKTCGFDWMKTTDDCRALAFGPGYWTRANTEPCLLATRGKPKRLDASVPMAVLTPRREHSRKPDCIHARIRRLVPGPYLELFGRRERKGWTVRGDEVGKFGSKP